MVPTAVPPPVARIPGARLLGTVGVIAVLTLLAVVVGARPWALPERVSSGWQVAEVPGSLAALLAVGTVVCLVTSTVVTFRTVGLRLGEPAGAAWLAIAGAAAGALVGAVMRATRGQAVAARARELILEKLGVQG